MPTPQDNTNSNHVAEARVKESKGKKKRTLAEAIFTAEVSAVANNILLNQTTKLTDSPVGAEQLAGDKRPPVKRHRVPTPRHQSKIGDKKKSGSLLLSLALASEIFDQNQTMHKNKPHQHQLGGAESGGGDQNAASSEPIPPGNMVESSDCQGDHLSSVLSNTQEENDIGGPQSTILQKKNTGDSPTDEHQLNRNGVSPSAGNMLHPGVFAGFASPNGAVSSHILPQAPLPPVFLMASASSSSGTCLPSVDSLIPSSATPGCNGVGLAGPNPLIPGLLNPNGQTVALTNLQQQEIADLRQIVGPGKHISPAQTVSPATRNSVAVAVAKFYAKGKGSDKKTPIPQNINVLEPVTGWKNCNADKKKDSLCATPAFECSEPGCGTTFNTRFSLKRHSKKHNGERLHKCPYDCGKRFAEKSTLTRHIRVHTGARPYICKYEGCGKSFADRTNIKRHELLHTGKRPYRCGFCTRGFYYPKHLAKHIQDTHADVSMPSLQGFISAAAAAAEAAVSSEARADGTAMIPILSAVPISPAGHIGNAVPGIIPVFPVLTGHIIETEKEAKVKSDEDSRRERHCHQKEGQFSISVAATAADQKATGLSKVILGASKSNSGEITTKTLPMQLGLTSENMATVLPDHLHQASTF